MTKETIETIRYALRFLKGVNETIIISSNSSKRIEQANNDVIADETAIQEFETFVLKQHLLELLGEKGM